MLIQKIVFQSSQTCTLTLEDNTSLELDILCVTSNNLREGDDVSQELLLQLQEDTAYINARKTAVHMLSRRMRTEKQLVQQLCAKGYSRQAVTRVIADLKNWGYIDDIAYAKTFIEYRLSNSKKSWRAILWELRREGLSTDDIDEATEDFDLDEEQRAQQVSEKILGLHRDQKSLERLKNALLRNGFSWDVVGGILSQYQQEYMEE